MYNKIFISIIIPTYNRENVICNLIDSLLSQINQSFEIIVIDDGSTDDTFNKIKVYKKYKNFYVYKIANSERGAARNYGAIKSSGNYLNFFDSDDIAKNNHIDLAIKKINQFNNPKVIAFSYAYKSIQKVKNIYINGKINNKIFSKNILSCNGVFIRKDIFNLYKFSENRDLSGSEDWHLWLRLSNKYDIFSFKEITSYIVDSEDRSMKTQTFTQINKRINYFINFIDNDFKKEITLLNKFKIKSELFSFLSMSSVITKEKKTLSIKYLLKSILYNPLKLFTRRSFILCYKLIFLW